MVIKKTFCVNLRFLHLARWARFPVMRIPPGSDTFFLAPPLFFKRLIVISNAVEKRWTQCRVGCSPTAAAARQHTDTTKRHAGAIIAKTPANAAKCHRSYFNSLKKHNCTTFVSKMFTLKPDTCKFQSHLRNKRYERDTYNVQTCNVCRVLSPLKRKKKRNDGYFPIYTTLHSTFRCI